MLVGDDLPQMPHPGCGSSRTRAAPAGDRPSEALPEPRSPRRSHVCHLFARGLEHGARERRSWRPGAPQTGRLGGLGGRPLDSPRGRRLGRLAFTPPSKAPQTWGNATPPRCGVNGPGRGKQIGRTSRAYGPRERAHRAPSTPSLGLSPDRPHLPRNVVPAHPLTRTRQIAHCGRCPPVALAGFVLSGGKSTLRRGRKRRGVP